MDILVNKIPNVCVLKTPLDKTVQNLPLIEIYECVEEPGRFIVFPIKNSACFYAYDKANRWFEQFDPAGRGSLEPDSIFDIALELDNFDITAVFTAETFKDASYGYYYAYMRLANPDRERDDVIKEVKDINNTNPSSFSKFIEELERDKSDQNLL